MTAHAEQANEHDGKQDDVCDQREYKVEVECTLLDIGNAAGILIRHPHAAELRIV